MSEQKIKSGPNRISPLMIGPIVKVHYLQGCEPCHFTAEPSTVKSVGVYNAAKSIAESLPDRKFLNWNRCSMSTKEEAVENPHKYFIFADIRASETDIGELRLQDLQNGKEYISFKYNILFQALSDERARGIIFFDEMNLAPNMIKAQFYKIINDRSVGDIPISREVLCCSAGNEAEHARGVTEDPVPLVLRRANYFVRPLSLPEWERFAISEGYNQYVVGFTCLFQSKFIHHIQYDLPDGVGQPCPRTWTKLNKIQTKEMVTELMNYNEKDDEAPKPMLEIISTGLLGQEVASQYCAYVKTAQSIDLDAVIKDPKKIRAYEEGNLSLYYAIVSALVDRYRSDKNNMLKPIILIANEMRKTELGTFLVRNVKTIDKNAFMKIGLMKVDPKVIDDFAKRYSKYTKDRNQ